jgi:hypothetical protein
MRMLGRSALSLPPTLLANFSRFVLSIRSSVHRWLTTMSSCIRPDAYDNARRGGESDIEGEKADQPYVAQHGRKLTASIVSTELLRIIRQPISITRRTHGLHASW